MTDSHPPLLISAPPPGWTGQPAGDAEADRLARRAMIFGILAFVVNPLLIPSIIGLTYGRKALKRGTTRRSEATVGVVTGSVSGAISILMIAVVLPLTLLWQHSAEVRLGHAIESSITATSARQGTPLTDVTCPTPSTVRAGSSITCTAQDGAAGPVGIQVTFTSTGSFTMRVVSVG